MGYRSKDTSGTTVPPSETTTTGSVGLRKVTTADFRLLKDHMNKHQTQGALAGVRILDMATVLAAPSGSTYCADHGADVVKLELPDGSDALRTLQPVKDGKALWWKVANRGKRGITLDVRTPRGREIFLQLLPKFDVLVENFRAGTMEKWGLGFDVLKQVNPRLVMVRLTGFGQTGPYRSRPGFARVFEAMSGFTNLTGEQPGSPLHMNFPIGDSVAGIFCAFSIAAEVARLRGDPSLPGVEVDLSATEALFRILDPLPVEHELLGFTRHAAGNMATYTAPSNMYKSKDGVSFSMVASSQSTFFRLADALGRTDWRSDSRYSTSLARIQHIHALDEELREWFGNELFDAIQPVLVQAEIPFSKVNTIEDVKRDPHFIERDAIVRIKDPDYGSIPAPCVVPRVTGRDLPSMTTGPDIGQHNAEIYAEIGIDDTEIDVLTAQGII